MEKLTTAQINAWRIISKSGLDSFTSVSLSTKEQKISGNTLSSLAKKGLLTKMTNSSPILYSINMEVMASMGLKLEGNKIMREENISLKERNEVLDILKNIDLDLKLKSKIERLLNKKQGLSFDEYKEEIEYQLQDDEGILVLSKKDEIIQDKNLKNNFLLEGDNLASLTLLQQNYKNKINCIYIDPPYNTLNKEFIYNDKMIGEDDMYRHSKWLSFMKKRLTIAKDLLADDGVIFISIDDNEQANLKLLCDDIFGEKNFITQFAWIASTKDINNGSNEEIPVLGANLGMFKGGYEYILCYRKTDKFTFALKSSDDKTIESRLTKNGNAISTLKLPKGLKTHSNLTKTFIGTIGGTSEPIKILTNEGMIFENGILMNDIELEAAWASAGLVLQFLNGQTVVDRRGQKVIEVYFKDTGIPYYVKQKQGDIPTNILSGYGDTSKARAALKEILNQDNSFSYPKPVKLIQDLIKLHSNKNAIILDFFAGSGTTGQAVMELNQEDGGNRQFILCTNNENNICENVTFPRNKTIITGICPDGTQYSDGLVANLQYYKVDIMTDENYDDNILINSKEYETQLKFGTNKITFVYTTQQLEQVLDNIEDYNGEVEIQ